MTAFWSLLPEGYEGGLKTYNRTQCSIPHLGRNKLVKEALDSDCTHILFMDDDMRFPMNTISQLLLDDKDIVAANCTTKEFPPRPTAKNDEPVFTNRDSEGLEEVQSVGTGIMMIKAEVFESLEKPWFDYEWLDKEELTILGEDRYFCKKAKQAGHKIFINHDISKNVYHVGDWPYGHQMTEQWNGSRDV